MITYFYQLAYVSYSAHSGTSRTSDGFPWLLDCQHTPVNDLLFPVSRRWAATYLIRLGGVLMPRPHHLQMTCYAALHFMMPELAKSCHIHSNAKTIPWQSWKHDEMNSSPHAVLCEIFWTRHRFVLYMFGRIWMAPTEMYKGMGGAKHQASEHFWED